MELKLFEANNGTCPYLKDKDWLSFMFQADYLDPQIYEKLIDDGFRRNGLLFYKNKCFACTQCRPLRVLVKEFAPSRSQKRVWKKNKDIEVVIEPVSFDRESYDLYQEFSKRRFDSQSTLEDYFNFLVQSAVDTLMMKYYLDHKLVGVGWVDVLSESLSSVYFAYDVEHSKRSLGVFSVLKEIELCQSMNKKNLHLGFFVDGCQTMLYKKQYHPHELLVGRHWVRQE